MRYRVSEAAHRALSWRVHDLLSDFVLEDVWRFPVELAADDTMPAFRDQLIRAMGRLGPAALLLELRLAVGRLLGWDRRLPGPGKIRARYLLQEHLETDATLPEPSAGFTPVYARADEHLVEVENATVLAALHLGRMPLDPGRAVVHLAVYVRPKGRLGRIYMALIRPWRRWIVYPAIMRAGAEQWRLYVASGRAGE